MNLNIKVPTIVCSEKISKAIQAQQSDAVVSMLITKVININTTATEAEITSIIVSTGHTPE